VRVFRDVPEFRMAVGRSDDIVKSDTAKPCSVAERLLNCIMLSWNILT
jgi:hypothetical protein